MHSVVHLFLYLLRFPFVIAISLSHWILISRRKMKILIVLHHNPLRYHYAYDVWYEPSRKRGEGVFPKMVRLG